MDESGRGRRCRGRSAMPALRWGLQRRIQPRLRDKDPVVAAIDPHVDSSATLRRMALREGGERHKPMQTRKNTPADERRRADLRSRKCSMLRCIKPLARL